MDTADKIGLGFVALVFLVIVGFLVYGVIDIAQQGRANTRASNQCWECGWSRMRMIDSRYFCVGWEDGAEVARSLEWVQENACQ